MFGTLIRTENGIITSNGSHFTEAAISNIYVRSTLPTLYSPHTGLTALDTSRAYYNVVRTTSTATTSPVWYVSNTANVWQRQNTQWIQPPDFKKLHPLVAPKKSIKNSIKRSLKLMMGMGFEEEVMIFLGGESIEICHPDSLFKFRITKKYNSIVRHTEYPGRSTPYNLELLTKGDHFIARLCVYMEDTPVLDQVFGVAMFIKSGSEEMILKQANWFALTNDDELKDIIALEYPHLADKVGRKESLILLPNEIH